MMMCKRLAQVPMLRVPIYNMKLAMMQKKKKLSFSPRFQHIRRWPPTSTGKTRCLPVHVCVYNCIYKNLYIILCYIYIYTYVCVIYTYAYTHTHIYIKIHA